MAIIPKQIGWSQESNLIWEILKQLNQLTAVTSKATRPYKVYSALLSQSGTSAPTAIVLENTLGDITFEYDDPGLYYIKSDSLFTTDKTWHIINEHQADEPALSSVFTWYSNSSTIELRSSSEGSGLDNLLMNTPIEIRVYE